MFSKVMEKVTFASQEAFQRDASSENKTSKDRPLKLNKNQEIALNTAAARISGFSRKRHFGSQKRFLMKYIAQDLTCTLTCKLTCTQINVQVSVQVSRKCTG